MLIDPPISKAAICSPTHVCWDNTLCDIYSPTDITVKHVLEVAKAVIATETAHNRNEVRFEVENWWVCVWLNIDGGAAPKIENTFRGEYPWSMHL